MTDTIRIETLAAVMAVSHDTLDRRIARGEIPSPDYRSRAGIGWRLSSIYAWNPAVAGRIEAGFRHKVFPVAA
jgi:predicted DNA-binding transcriptional regulator AlpA